MKTRYALLSAFGLVLMLCTNSVRAKQPPQIPAYDDGQLVYITVVNANVVGVDQPAIANKAANPIYFVGYFDDHGNWVDVQPHVLSIGLGEAGYNPYWDVNYVEVNPDTFTGEFTSGDEIPQDWVWDSGFILLCQQISR